MANILDYLINAAKKTAQNTGNQIITQLKSNATKPVVKPLVPTPPLVSPYASKTLKPAANSWTISDLFKPQKVETNISNATIGKKGDNYVPFTTIGKAPVVPLAFRSQSNEERNNIALQARQQEEWQRIQDEQDKGFFGALKQSIPNAPVYQAPIKAAQAITEPFRTATTKLGKDINQIAPELDSSAKARTAVNLASTIYEGGKLYYGSGLGGTASKLANTATSLSKPGIVSGLASALPENMQGYVRPVLETASVLKSPQKLVGALNVFAGRATDPASNAINSSDWSQPAKDAANLVLNIFENAVAVKGGKYISGKAAPSVAGIKAGYDAYQKGQPIEGVLDSALKAKDALMPKTVASDVPQMSKVLGFNSGELQPVSKAAWDKAYANAIKSGDIQKINALTAGKGVDSSGAKPTAKLGVDYNKTMAEFANQGKLVLPEDGKRTPSINDEAFNNYALRNKAYEAEVAKDKSIGEDMNNSGVVNTKAKDIINRNINWDNTGKEKFNALTKKFRTLQDGIKRFFGPEYSKVEDIQNNFDDAKGAFIKSRNDKFTDLKKTVIDDLGIKKGSKDDILVREFGEKKITLEQLKQASPKNWGNIVEADKYFRKLYDTYLPEVNSMRSQLYPNDASKLVPARENYYRHGEVQPKTGLGQAYKALTTDAEISPDLAGLTSDTKPISKFASIAQKRKGETTKIGAIDGAIDYIKQAEFIKNVEPQIAVLRSLAKATAASMGDDPRANSFIEMLHAHANDIAGKTTGEFDRAVQGYVGRKPLNVLTGLVNQVKANQIVMNVASGFNQLATIPTAAMEIGPVKLTQALLKNFGPEQEKSTFLNERYNNAEKIFDTGATKAANVVKDTVNGAVEEAMMRKIWDAAYLKGQGLGEKEPGRYADRIAKEIVGGRGIGEVPLAFKDKVLNNTVLMYQLETGNTFNRLKDNIKGGQLKKLLYYSVAAHAFNLMSKSVTGRSVVLDPYQAAVNAYTSLSDESEKGKAAKGILEALGRVIGEGLSQMPGGNAIEQLFPQYGNSILPPRNQLFGDADTTRVGGSIFDALNAYNALPYGGNQLKKTYEGINTVLKGYKADKSGNVLSTVEQSPVNYLKAALFGSSSLPEVSGYYDNNRTPLSDADSRSLSFMSPEEQKKYYTQVQADKEHVAQIKKLKDEADRVYTGSGLEQASVVDLRKQFYELKADPTPAQLEKALKASEESIGSHYYGMTPDEVKADIVSGNKLAAYLAFDDSMIDKLVELGKDPSQREAVKQKINQILDDEEANAYDDPDRAETRGKSVTSKVKKSWDLIK